MALRLNSRRQLMQLDPSIVKTASLYGISYEEVERMFASAQMPAQCLTLLLPTKGHQNTPPALLPLNPAAFSTVAAGRIMRRAIRWQNANPTLGPDQAPSHIRSALHMIGEVLS